MMHHHTGANLRQARIGSRSQLGDHSTWFMARYSRSRDRKAQSILRTGSTVDMKIRTAHSGGFYRHHGFPRTGRRIRKILQFQSSVAKKDYAFHGLAPLASTETYDARRIGKVQTAAEIHAPKAGRHKPPHSKRPKSRGPNRCAARPTA
jgi:hypothetical protein